LKGRENFPSVKIFAHRRSSLVRHKALADTMPARRTNASQSAGLGILKLLHLQFYNLLSTTAG
jgi:hypothetical protein